MKGGPSPHGLLISGAMPLQMLPMLCGSLLPLGLFSLGLNTLWQRIISSGAAPLQGSKVQDQLLFCESSSCHLTSKDILTENKLQEDWLTKTEVPWLCSLDTNGYFCISEWCLWIKCHIMVSVLHNAPSMRGTESTLSIFKSWDDVISGHKFWVLAFPLINAFPAIQESWRILRKAFIHQESRNWSMKVLQHEYKQWIICR